MNTMEFAKLLSKLNLIIINQLKLGRMILNNGKFEENYKILEEMLKDTQEENAK